MPLSSEDFRASARETRASSPDRLHDDRARDQRRPQSGCLHSSQTTCNLTRCTHAPAAVPCCQRATAPSTSTWSRLRHAGPPSGKSWRANTALWPCKPCIGSPLMPTPFNIRAEALDRRSSPSGSTSFDCVCSSSGVCRRNTPTPRCFEPPGQSRTCFTSSGRQASETSRLSTCSPLRAR